MTGKSRPLPLEGGQPLRRIIWGGLGAVLALVVGLGAWSLATGHGAAGAGGGPQAPLLEGPGDFGEVPGFALTDRSGRAVTRQDLLGRFWIADFIFTRCTGICPILTARMASLTRALAGAPGGGEVRFVSFSVDPEWDTPEVLGRYAAAGGAAGVGAAGRWLFLTGPRDDLYELIGEGFRLNVAQRSPGEPAADGELITHSDRFVLVDPAGRIRGYYHGTDEESIRRLVRDLETMRREPGR